MKLDPLLLFSGNDIPFTSSGVTIHHPTIREIAYLGEDTFFTGYQMLIISKNILSQEEKVALKPSVCNSYFFALPHYALLVFLLIYQNLLVSLN